MRAQISSFCSGIVNGNLNIETLELACSSFAKAVFGSSTNLQEALEQFRWATTSSLDSLVVYVSCMALENASENTPDASACAEEVVKGLLGCEMDSSNNALALKVGARLALRHWDRASPLILPHLKRHDDEENWSDNDVLVGFFTRAMALVRFAILDGKYHADVARDVLPIWLDIASSPVVSPLRREQVLRYLHLFYVCPEEGSVDRLWDAIASCTPSHGLALFCRVSKHLGKRWSVWLHKAEMWKYLFDQVATVVKNTPLAFAKQSTFAWREAIEACVSEKVALSFSPWFSWDPKIAKETARDWDGWLALFELMEQYSVYLIEPVWPSLEKLASARRIPGEWLRLLVKRGLHHDSIHVTRMVLVFLMQADPNSLWWLDPDFFCGPFLSSLLLPSLYRGVSAMVFPSLVFEFWKRKFTSGDDRVAIVRRLVPEFWPANPKLHHNVLAVPVLMRLVAETGVACITNVSEAGKIVLLTRSHYCVEIGWKMLTECVDVASFSSFNPGDLFARMEPHTEELMLEHGLLVRQFFAKTSLNRRELPKEDVRRMALCAFASSSHEEMMHVLKSAGADAHRVIAALAGMCRGGLKEVSALVPVEVLQQPTNEPIVFGLRCSYDESAWSASLVPFPTESLESVFRGIRWLNLLSDPWWVESTGSSGKVVELLQASVPWLLGLEKLDVVLKSSVEERAKLSHARWACLAQVGLLVGEPLGQMIAAHASEVVADTDTYLEFSTLLNVFECCTFGPTVLFAGHMADSLSLILRRRFDEIVSMFEQRDAFPMMKKWAMVALGHVSRSLGVAPKCLELLLAVERQHDRFIGVVADVVERDMLPRWKRMIQVEDSFLVQDRKVDADLIALLARQGYTRDDSRKLDGDGDEEGPKKLFSLSRAYVAAFLESLPNRSSPLAGMVVLKLLLDSVEHKRTLDAGREADRVATQFAGSAAHLLSVRIWQVISLASSKMGRNDDAVYEQMASLVNEYLQGFFLPSLAVYMESFLVEFLTRFPRFVPMILIENLKNFAMKAAQAKVVLGVTFVLVHQGRLNDNDLVERLVSHSLPFVNAVHNPVSNRLVFMCCLMAKEKRCMEMLQEGTRYCVAMISNYCDRCPELSRKVFKGEEDWLVSWIGLTNLRVLFFEIPVKAPEIISECFTPDIMEKALKFFDVPQFNIPKLKEGVVPMPMQHRTEEAMGQDMTKDIRSLNAADSFYQRKIIPWHMLKLDEADHREAVISSTRRLPMIVCASFIEKAPNIGGLTRTSEVFGLESIAINDMSIMNSKEYTAVAVTAERWIRTDHVPVDQVSQWLLKMNTERGYAIVGLEQSNESVMIQDFVFPEKCVLVLGNELRGLPAPIMSMLTCVVEIPQLGTIRSLNVHVSASIMISQYVFQQLAKRK